MRSHRHDPRAGLIRSGDQLAAADHEVVAIDIDRAAD
jgi:hypothetical protein